MPNLSTTTIEPDGTLSKPLLKSDAEAFNDYAQELWAETNHAEFLDMLVEFGAHQYKKGVLATLDKLETDFTQTINEHGKSN